jgi:hypothetical protein
MTSQHIKIKDSEFASDARNHSQHRRFGRILETVPRGNSNGGLQAEGFEELVVQVHLER